MMIFGRRESLPRAAFKERILVTDNPEKGAMAFCVALRCDRGLSYQTTSGVCS